MVKKDIFLMKPKPQYHSSQWGEWVYGPQSWKERRLLQEFVFVLIDKWSKKWWKDKLFLWSQSINVIYHNKENELMVPNHENKGDYYLNLCLSQLTNEL